MAEPEKKHERELVQELITRSEDEFEKKITYISAGALLLSVTLVEKILQLDNSSFVWILISGWVFLVLTLIVNLLSHLVSKYFLRKNIDDIDESVEYSIRLKRHNNRTFCIELLNWVSVFLLILGISAMVTFTSLNASQGYHKKNIKNESTDCDSKTIIIQNH